jgi:hypothetical protein
LSLVWHRCVFRVRSLFGVFIEIPLLAVLLLDLFTVLLFFLNNIESSFHKKVVVDHLLNISSIVDRATIFMTVLNTAVVFNAHAIVLHTAGDTLWLDVCSEIVPKLGLFDLDIVLVWLDVVDHKVYYRFSADLTLDVIMPSLLVFRLLSLLNLIQLAINLRLLSFYWGQNFQEPSFFLLKLELFLLFEIVYVISRHWVNQWVLALYAHVWVVEHVFVNVTDTQLEHVCVRMGLRFVSASATVTSNHSRDYLLRNWRQWILLLWGIHINNTF